MISRYSAQDEIEAISEEILLTGAFNAFLSLPTFPRCLFFDRRDQSFYEVHRYDRRHRNKVYQPVYNCSFADLPSGRRLISHKSFPESCGLINLASFYQSGVYFTYLFVISLNQHLPRKLRSWEEVGEFMGRLGRTEGYKEYLCWLDVFKSSSRDSKQAVRLKYFRPNPVCHVSSITYTENRGDLMERIVRNIARYWAPRLAALPSPDASLETELASCDREMSPEQWRALLISVISYEELAGHVLQNFLLAERSFAAAGYLSFLKACFSFYGSFSHESVDTLWANRSAWRIISEFLMPGGKSYVPIPEKLLELIKSSASPPYDDLFDGAVEFALHTLLPWLQQFYGRYSRQFDEIPEESYCPSESTAVEEVGAQREEEEEEGKRPETPTLEEKSDTLSERRPGGRKEGAQAEVYLSNILRSRDEFERFKQFLSKQGQVVSVPRSTSGEGGEDKTPLSTPLADLECYIEIEKFKLAKEKPAARDELAVKIKQAYLTKRYFFGPLSPAPRDAQIKILGGSGHKMPPRPPSPTLLEVQRFVSQRLCNKWVKAYRASEEYQRRHDRAGSSLGRSRYKGGGGGEMSQTFVFVDAKSRANAHDMLQLRKTLMDRGRCEPLKRYARAKNERLLRDIEFWVEVQRYKDIHHRHSSTSLIRKKIDTIIDCFLDSTIPPKVQISVPNEIAIKIAESRYDLGPYIFRQAQSLVNKVLVGLWSEFNTWCAKHKDEPLPFTQLEVEQQQKKLVKQLLRQKQKEEERERAFFETANRSSTAGFKRTSRVTSVASSTTTSEIKQTVEKIEEFIPTVHWKLSDTVPLEPGESEKRKRALLRDILDKGMFKDDAGFRNYLTEKMEPKAKVTTSPSPVQKLSRSTRPSAKTSFDSTASKGSSKSYRSLSKLSQSRTNFDRIQLVSISEKLTVPSRNLSRRRQAVSHQRSFCEVNSDRTLVSDRTSMVSVVRDPS